MFPRVSLPFSPSLLSLSLLLPVDSGFYEFCVPQNLGGGGKINARDKRKCVLARILEQQVQRNGAL